MKNKENKNISRRDFTKLAAAGAIGGAISTALPVIFIGTTGAKTTRH